jgi:hypothetical protein
MNTAFNPEKLMKGIDVVLAQSNVDYTTRHLKRLGELVGTPTAHPDIERHIFEAEAALETHNRNLGSAKIAAGFVS